MKRPSTWYSGTRHRSRIAFAYGAVTLSGGPFQAASANEPICNSTRDPQLPPDGPTTPRLQRLRPITQPRFGLLRFRSPLLTECSLLLEVLRCFSSLGVLAPAMDSPVRSRALPREGFPIRKSPDRRLLAAARSVSSPATSFIGSWRQGIHRVLFVA